MVFEWTSLLAQPVKTLPARQETRVRSLGQEDPLEEGIWQPTLVFLLGEFHGQRSLEGYSLWGRRESDTTKQTNTNTDMARHCPKSCICNNDLTF